MALWMRLRIRTHGMQARMPRGRHQSFVGWTAAVKGVISGMSRIVIAKLAPTLLGNRRHLPRHHIGRQQAKRTVKGADKGCLQGDRTQRSAATHTAAA